MAAQRRPAQRRPSQTFANQASSAQRRPTHWSLAQRRPCQSSVAQRRPAQRRPSKVFSSACRARISAAMDQALAAHLRVWGVIFDQAAATAERSPDSQACPNSAHSASSASAGPKFDGVDSSCGSGGTALRGVESAAAKSRAPLPAPVFVRNSLVRLAVPITSRFAWSGVNSGCSDSSTASDPAVTAADIEVPDPFRKPSPTCEVGLSR